MYSYYSMDIGQWQSYFAKRYSSNFNNTYYTIVGISNKNTATPSQFQNALTLWTIICINEACARLIELRLKMCLFVILRNCVLNFNVRWLAHIIFIAIYMMWVHPVPTFELPYDLYCTEELYYSSHLTAACHNTYNVAFHFRSLKSRLRPVVSLYIYIYMFIEKLCNALCSIWCKIIKFIHIRNWICIYL